LRQRLVGYCSRAVLVVLVLLVQTLQSLTVWLMRLMLPTLELKLVPHLHLPLFMALVLALLVLVRLALVGFFLKVRHLPPAHCHLCRAILRLLTLPRRLVLLALV